MAALPANATSCRTDQSFCQAADLPGSARAMTRHYGKASARFHYAGTSHTISRTPPAPPQAQPVSLGGALLQGNGNDDSLFASACARGTEYATTGRLAQKRLQQEGIFGNTLKALWFHDHTMHDSGAINTWASPRLSLFPEETEPHTFLSRPVAAATRGCSILP